VDKKLTPKTKQLGNLVKHLLILLSILLLLSSPLFGQSQETNVLYRWKTSSGFQWKTFGNGEVKPKYVGEMNLMEMGY